MTQRLKRSEEKQQRRGLGDLLEFVILDAPLEKKSVVEA